MKIAEIVIRSLLGLLLLFGSISYLFDLIPPPELTGNVKIFMDGMVATGYLMTLVKVTELLCGLAFLSGLFVPLAAVVFAPIAINIFMFHLMVAPPVVPVAAFVLFANLFLGFAHWNKYRPMLAAR